LPVLDVPNASMNVGERSDCDADDASDKAYHRGEGAHRVSAKSQVHAIVPSRALAPPCVALGPLADCPAATRPNRGVRSAIERPPR
jgi:hypothetical protein